METQMIDIKDLLDKLEDRDTRLRAAEETYHEQQREIERLKRKLEEAHEKIEMMEELR